jgi:excisionase family DNA binding protein
LRRTNSAQRRKVEDAKRLVQLALGDAVRPDHPRGQKFVPMAKAEPVEVRSEAVYVLSLGEVAALLNISRAEVQRMTATGRMKSLLVGGLSVMVTTIEVERVLGERYA